MIIQKLVDFLNQSFPPAFQEDYDNTGLLTGNPDEELSGVLLTVDVTEEVVEEAVDKNVNFILAHHPLIFKGLKSLTGKNHVERTVIKAIQNGIAIYAAHTNLDNAHNGVNFKLAEKLGLENTAILQPFKDELVKLVFFVPHEHANTVREAVFAAGAGKIGEYDACSYNLDGQGSFRPGEGTDPFVGEKGKLHFEPETRVETIMPRYLTSKVVKAMIEAHPYEEVAYDLYPLLNEYNQAGSGMIGTLKNAVREDEFLSLLKKKFKAQCIKYTSFDKPIQTVAICGGSGSFLLSKAISSGADAFITADLKYHQFFDAEDKILLADIGHFESEEVTKEIFYELLTEKFHNFAIHLSDINTNPINYY
ncbi:MAG: Nif3-like dinuclear metal center hexameric protein [Bacteroidales bacterium]